MANTLALTLYRARSSHLSNAASNDVATLINVQEAVQKELDDPGPTRYFICQLLNAEVSSQKSVLQKLDQSSPKKPQSTGLGTLNELPLEVRRRIWHEVLKAQFFNVQHLGSELFRYVGGTYRMWHPSGTLILIEDFIISVFRPESYSIRVSEDYTEREYAGWSNEHLPRLISHAVKGELEDLHLRNNIFAFEYEHSLDLFLDQLSQHHALQLRRISLLLLPRHGCNVKPCWGRVIERLPKTINIVLITLDALQDFRYRESFFQYLTQSKKFITRVLSAADVLRNQILRQLPHARVVLVGTLFDQLKASYRAAFETLSLDKVWSKVDRKTLL